MTQGRPRADRLRVGVTLHLRNGDQSIWENGIFQNVVFLAQLFRRSPAVADAVIVVDREEHTPPPESMLLDKADVRLVTLREALETLDVVVEMSAQLSEEWVRQFRGRGGRYALMRVGNDYVIDIERAIFNLPPAGLCSGKTYDGIWTIPEFERSCVQYFSLTTRAPVTILPHLWSPQFFDHATAQLPPGETYGFDGTRPRWRVCTFEPNLCTVKTSVIPLAAMEHAYRLHPQMFEEARVCNAMKIKERPVFVNYAMSLHVVQHGVATFEARYPLYAFMARHGDCVVTHHWENGQNYLYYELLHGGYPLIHNSEFIKGCGYFYPEFDAEEAGRVLVHAFRNHAAHLGDYKADAQRLLRTLAVDYEPNVEAYTRALLRLFE